MPSKIKIKKFLREDLFKKLNLNVIEVPNLEKRKEDLDELISIFSSQVIVEKALKIKVFHLMLYYI